MMEICSMESMEALSDSALPSSMKRSSLGLLFRLRSEHWILNLRIGELCQRFQLEDKLNLHSLLGLDALFDPPRLMASEATLDVPSATTTPNAEPQQGASTAHTTPEPTAASDMLPEHSQGSQNLHSAATERASGHDAANLAPATVPTESQTPDLSAGTQGGASSNTDGSPTANDAESDASPNTATGPKANDGESDASTTTIDGPVANDADTSTSHTAMMESQAPEMVLGSQGNGSPTAASGSLAKDASTDTQSESAGTSPSSTSAGISVVSNVWSYGPMAVFLLLSSIF